ISCFLQQTDVAQARLVAQWITDQMDRKDGGSAAAMAPLLSAMDSLLTSEGARRRLRIEIERRDEREAAPVRDIVDRRNKLASSERLGEPCRLLSLTVLSTHRSASLPPVSPPQSQRPTHTHRLPRRLRPSPR